MTTRELLSKLVSFDTISHNSNRELMDFIVSWLQQHGIKSQLIPDASGGKANLYASVLPNAEAHQNAPGIVLSGHTDVVPIEGQNWTVPAFSMTERDNRYYGRGTTDMKGFVACALTAMASAKTRPLTMPLHLALSYDEEIGCVGVRSLIDMLAQHRVKPRLCIVGEPTMMMVATRHKGKCAARAHFTGREGHSALAPHNLNAIHLACDFVTQLRVLQTELAEPYKHSDSTTIPYTTVHAGIIQGGTALNIVPNHCTVDFEIRNGAADDANQILDTIMAETQRSVALHQQQFPEASVTFDVVNEYPGLNTLEDTWAVEFMKSLTGANDCSEVAFGTEAGLFSSKLSIPSVVCGPGSMAQGHKPDEYIDIEQMTQCETVLQRLLDRMCDTTEPMGQ